VDAAKANLTRVEMVGSKLLGVKLIEARMRDILWSECIATFANFYGTRFKAARFHKCGFKEASFQEADLTGAVFDTCDLSGTNFHGATLAGADLRGSNLTGIQIDIATLRGVIVDQSQAVVPAALMGLVIR
jgi:uncharacterized protein YjbI with pentapeptide repeats